jgi:hypothetical protein
MQVDGTDPPGSCQTRHKWREARLFRTAHISNNVVLTQAAQHIPDMPRSY